MSLGVSYLRPAAHVGREQIRATEREPRLGRTRSVS
jgi:hypothetical protein